MSDAIVVTGVGVVSPLGTGSDEAWRAFAAGDGGIRVLADGDQRLQRGVDPNAVPEIGRAGWVRGFEPRAFIRSPHLRRMDWCSRMLVAVVRQAFDAAGLGELAEDARPRTALVVGSAFGNQRETAVYLERVLKTGPAAAQPMLFPNLVLNAAAGYAAIELGVEGPNVCVAEHEASGEAALATAFDLLRSGICDVVCAAGVDELSGFQIETMSHLRLLHPDSMTPEGRELAWRRGRGTSGAFVPGEGAAALVLERAAHARSRGARARATLAAARVGACEAGAYALPRDAEAAAARLLELAGEPASSISGVVGGANGVAARDRFEAALQHALAAAARRPAGYAPYKRLVGDWGAAGALAAALAVLALEAGVLPGGPQPAGGEAAAVHDPRRLLVPGVARGGALVPLLFDHAG